MLLALLCFSAGLYAQEISFEEYNPTSTLVVPGAEIEQAKFPFVDVHSHQRDMSVSRLGELVTEMDALNAGQ